MFSGIVAETGTVIAIAESDAGSALTISFGRSLTDLLIGESISISGTCLTVVDLDETEHCFIVEVTKETLRCTTLGLLSVGDKVNLERSLTLLDRLGGHLVTGHVDAIGTVESIEAEGFSKVVCFSVAADLAPFFVEKGSVAINGVSLTVWGLSNKAREASQSNGEDIFSFKVALIPLTMAITNLSDLQVGSKVNIETDIIARHVARWLEPTLNQRTSLTPGQKLVLNRS